MEVLYCHHGRKLVWGQDFKESRLDVMQHVTGVTVCQSSQFCLRLIHPAIVSNSQANSLNSHAFRSFSAIINMP